MGQELSENLAVVAQFLNKEEWHYDVESEGIFTGFKGNHSSFTVNIYDTGRDLIFRAALPVDVPKEKRSKLAEFITRVNYSLHIGNLEMDFADGIVDYVTVVMTDDIVISEKIAKRSLFTTCFMFDVLHDRLMSQIYSDTTPAEEEQKVDEFFSQ